MIRPYRRSARRAALVFIITLLLALVFSSSHLILLAQLAFLISYIAAFVWYYNFAKAKGYSGWWALLGFLHLIGFIVILLLPNRTRNTPVSQA